MNILEVLSLPFTGPLKAAIWAAEQINEKVMAEMYDPDELRGQLLQVRISFERGAISQLEYDAQTAVIWERLRAIESDGTVEGDEDAFTTDQGE